MQTPGTALIVVALVDGSRLAFEHSTAGRGWFKAAMKQAAERVMAGRISAATLVVIDGTEVFHYGRSELAELLGGA